MNIQSHRIRKIKKRELLETLRKAEQNDDLKGFELATIDYSNLLMKEQNEWKN